MLVNYLNIVEKHTFNMMNFTFKLYNNIIFHDWADFDLVPGPNRGVVKAYFRLSNKVSMIWSSSHSSSFLNASNEISSMEIVSYK